MKNAEIAPPKDQVLDHIDPVVDHEPGKRYLLMQFPFSREALSGGCMASDMTSHRYGMMATLDEMIAKGFSGNTAILDSVLNPGSGNDLQQSMTVGVVDMVDTVAVRSYSYLRNAYDQGEIRLLDGSPDGANGPFIRDEIIPGSVNGRPVLGAPYYSSLLFRRTPESAIGNLSAFSRVIPVGTGFLPMYLEGGNTVASRRHLFVGRDAISHFADVLSLKGKSQVSYLQARSRLEQLLSRGRQMVVFDENGGSRREQEVYHADLSLLISRDRFGREIAFVSSMRKAREILTDQGMLDGNGKLVSQKTWMRANQYPEMDEAVSHEHAKRIAKGLERLDHPLASIMRKQGVYTEVIRQAREQAFDLMQDARKCLDRVGGGLELFFREDNYPQVQSYLDRVSEVLSGLGYPVVEVPALLYATDFFDRNVKPKDHSMTIPFGIGGKSGSVTIPGPQQKQSASIPIYCPVNGIQWPGSDGISLFAAGFIRTLDREASRIFGEHGIRHVPVMRAASFGFELAGLHCLGITL